MVVVDWKRHSHVTGPGNLGWEEESSKSQSLGQASGTKFAKKNWICPYEKTVFRYNRSGYTTKVGCRQREVWHPGAPYTLGFWHEETHRRLAAPDAAAGRAHGSAREGAEQRAGTADQWAAWRAKMPPKTDNDDAFSEYVANPAYQFYK